MNFQFPLQRWSMKWQRTRCFYYYSKSITHYNICLCDHSVKLQCTMGHMGVNISAVYLFNKIRKCLLWGYTFLPFPKIHSLTFLSWSSLSSFFQTQTVPSEAMRRNRVNQAPPPLDTTPTPSPVQQMYRIPQADQVGHTQTTAWTILQVIIQVLRYNKGCCKVTWCLHKPFMTNWHKPTYTFKNTYSNKHQAKRLLLSCVISPPR